MKLTLLLTAIMFLFLSCDQLPWLSPKTAVPSSTNRVQDELTAGKSYFYFVQSAPSGSLIPIKGSPNYTLTLYGAQNFTLYFSEGLSGNKAALSGQLDTQDVVSQWANKSTLLAARGAAAALQLLGNQKSATLALMNVSRPKIDMLAGTLQFTVSPASDVAPFSLPYQLTRDQLDKIPAHFGRVILTIAAQGDVLQPILTQYQALYQEYDQRLQSISGAQEKNKQELQQYQEQLASVQQDMEKTKGQDPQVRQKFEALQKKIEALQTHGKAGPAPDSQLTSSVQALMQEIQRLLAAINDGT